MIDKQELQRRIARCYEMPKPTLGFLMLYRDLAISIGDDEIEGDPEDLCRMVTFAELSWGAGHPLDAALAS